MPLSIAMIGAGSSSFSRRLMQDLLAVPELAETTFAHMDIDPRNLDMVTQLCQRDIRAHRLPATIISTLDRREALQDADYVICTIRQGRLEAFQLDIDVPLKYGVDQCVGDTICAGGLMYAQRTQRMFCQRAGLFAGPLAALLRRDRQIHRRLCHKAGGN